jgi:methionyl-tRNA formyltransferase
MAKGAATVKTLFIGGTKRGYQTLSALLEAGHHVCGIISLQQDAHEIERYEEPIRRLADERGIPLFETKWLKDRDYTAVIRDEMKPDIALAVGCRIIIPEEIYGIPAKGTVAVHDSLLPEYRGFAPLNWSIINDEAQTGVSLFYLNPLMDCGDIVNRKAVPIGADETAPEVYEKVCRATIDVVLESWPALAAGTASRTPQDPATGSYTCSRIPADGMIDWAQPTRNIWNLIRALVHPYPGAFTFFRDRKVTIRRAQPLEPAPRYTGRSPGRVVRVAKDEGSIDVLTADGIIRILEIELDGRVVPAATVISSVKESLGLDPLRLLARIEKLEKKMEEPT